MSGNSSAAGGHVAFQYPAFRFFILARFLATASSEMQAVAVGWQVYARTNRPLDLGLVGLAQFLPGIFLFLVAGHTADHHSRKRILQTCYAGFALCSLLLTFTVHGTGVVWPIYLVLLFNGVVRAFNGPTSQAFLPQLVPAEHFPNAVTWGGSAFQTAVILGPVIGGLLYGLTGSPMPVYLSAAVAYSTALIAVSLVEAKTPQRPRGTASIGVVLEGFRYIGRNKMVLGAITMDLFAVLLGGAVALLPVYAKEILHVGAVGLGCLRSAPAGGAVLMAVIVAHWPLRRYAGRIMLCCVFGFGVCTVVFGLSRNVVLSLIALMLLGACDMVSVIVRGTLVQLSTPDEMRGRVSAVNMLFVGASNELGQFESGITAQWFGTVPAVVLGGLGTMLVVVLWWWMFPALRDADELVRKEPAVVK